MAFNEIVSNHPPRYTELCETVNKAFEEISDSISPEEFKNILGDISFLKSKKNVANLLHTLKTQFRNHMSKHFDQIIEEENLSELFTKKDTLNEELAKKYLVDNDSLELIEMEESLHKLDVQIAKLEETNEVLFNQGKFNEQRFDQLSERITKLINECQTKYTDCVQQTDIIREEFTNVL